jgi:hypothetical protein
MDFSLTTLYVLNDGSLAPDGFKRENLRPTQFGVFNSRYKAVTSATDAVKSPYIQFGQGRIEKIPGLGDKYSDKVSRDSVIEWYKVNASPGFKNQITYAGFDGIDDTKTIKVGCDEQVSLTIRARSLYIDQAFAYGLTRTVTFTTPCCEDCGDNCEVVDPRIIANAWAEKINAEPWLSKFVVASPISDCETPETPPTVINTVTYCTSFCDNGDDSALAAVQSQYVNDIVIRSERVGSISTYQLERLATAGAPANAVITLPVRLSVCDSCPVGYTLQGESEQYIIETALDGSEDLNSSADRQTFANTVRALYVPATTFNGATNVDPATDQITLTGHNYTTGESITYSNGGGTSITGLTSGNTYYVIRVDANNIKLASTRANALANTPIDITADGVGAAQTVTGSSSAVFLENKGGSATVLIKVDASFPELVTPVLADIITKVDNIEAVCLPPAGTSYAWTSCDTGYKVQRTLRITVTNDCNSDLAAVQAQYPNDTVTLVSTANCNSQYQLVQTSETVHEDCELAVPAKFPQVQPYKGIEWEVVPTVLTGATCVAGVKIEGKPLDKYGNPCDPIAFPHELDKLTFEVFAYKAPATSQDFITHDRCDFIPITTTQKSTYSLGSGDEIYEMEKKFHSYQTTMKHIFHQTAYNGGFVRYSVPSTFYDTYVIKFKAPTLNTWDNVSRQDESVIIAVPTGTGQNIENFLLGYFGEEKFTAGVLGV